MSDAPAPVSLAELIAPMPVAELRELLRERRRLHHQPGATRFEGLVDWDGLLRLVESGDVPTRYLRVTRGGKRVPQIFFHEQGQRKAAVIRQMMANNASILAEAAEEYVPAIGTLCAAIAAELGENVGTAMIATMGEGGALDLHFDDYDLIVLQVEGTKAWLIHEEPIVDPVRGMGKMATGQPDGPVREIEVREGDWLFVPAGYWHRCETRTERSLHLGIMIYPLTMTRVLDLLMRDLQDSPEHRKPLRFEVGQDAAAEAALKQRLIDHISSLSLTELLHRHQTVSVVPGRREESARGDGGHAAP